MTCFLMSPLSFSERGGIRKQKKRSLLLAYAEKKGKVFALIADLELFSAKLDAAIDSAMQGPVAEGAKTALGEAVMTQVYGVYAPQFLSRRGYSGGLADPGTMTVSYTAKTLTLQADAPWQQLWGGKVPGSRLAEEIAAGSSRYHFQNAGPRPFHSEAENEFTTSGQFESLLGQGLHASGFVAHRG